MVKICFIISLGSFLLIIGVAPATGQSESRDQLLKFYESCITKKIANCRAKTALKTSRSSNLKRVAKLSAKKMVFFTTNKNMLINEMVDQEIGQKHYKVDYYLNKRFSEMVK